MTKRRNIAIALIVLMLIVGSATAALARSTDSHDVGGNLHGHVAVNDVVHAWTQHDHDTKHVSVDNVSSGFSVCELTSAVTHVDCQSDGLVTTAWWSHHTGPHISNHIMSG